MSKQTREQELTARLLQLESDTMEVSVDDDPEYYESNYAWFQREAPRRVR